VDIKVLSGDNPITVSRVCMMAGLKKGDRYIDASKLPDDIASLSKIIDDYQVFGRVKPEQKELIIQALQKKEHIVAMVGDGVNDVLAIKESDCGIAMANGADAAKHSAHIVLLDSQFSSMKDIFKEGRTIVANIEKVSALYLTKTIYSTGLSLIFSLIGKAYPFTPFQLSIISSFAIGYPSFFITLEKDVDMQSKGFLRHVLNTALPCGLSIIFYVLLSLFMTSYLSLNMRTFNTLSYYMTVLVSFIVLYKVCLPLNKYRKAIFGICSVCVVVALVFLSKYLSIYSLFDFHSILVIPLALSSFIMTALFTNIINKMRLRNVIKQAKKYFI
jgi:cation-transporting ATPase E